MQRLSPNTDPESTSAAGSIVSILAIVAVVVFAGVLLVQLHQTAAVTPGELTVVDLAPGNETVDEAERIDISATVENTGNTTVSETVELSVGDERERVSLTLAPGEAETVRVRDIEAGTLGIGSTVYRASTAHDEATATLVVESDRPPVFEITAFSPDNLTIVDDPRANISAVIENTGGTTANQSVELRVDNDTHVEHRVELEPGESEPLEFFNVHFGWLAPGEHTHGIYTENDSATGTVTVLEEALLSLQYYDFDPGNVTLSEGEQITVTATIENPGGYATDGTLELSFNNASIRTRAIALEPHTDTTVTFADIPTEQFGVGRHNYTLSTDDTSVTGQLIIEGDEPANTEISRVTPANATVERDGSFNVSALIENTGARTANETVELLLDGEPRRSTPIELAPGESGDLRFDAVSVADLDPGEYTYRLETPTDNETATVVIAESVSHEPS